MRRFIIITQSLDPLPEEKYMSMRILFNDECPDDYQPPFFKDASDEPIATVKMVNSVDNYSAGVLSTGFHDINLNITIAPVAVSPGLSLREYDPFIVPKREQNASHTRNHEPKIPQLKVTNEVPSQTTLMLRTFLENSQSNKEISTTQALSLLNCECGSNRAIKESKTVECAICGKQVHSLCYALAKKTVKVNCFTCRSKSLSDVGLNKNLRLIMNLRKLYKVLLANDIPSHISLLHNLIGFEIGDSNIETTKSMLSFAILNGLILVEESPMLTNKKGKRSGSGYCYIDIDGIFSVDHEEILPTRYGVTFVPGLKGIDTIELRSTTKRLRDLLFEETQGKCLSIDVILNQFTIYDDDFNAKDEYDPIIDSSSVSSSPTKNSIEVENHFSNLNINSSKDLLNSYISSPVISKKRGIRGTIGEEDTTKNNDCLTSQPIITEPRRKK